MLTTELTATLLASSTPIRNEPVQARSTARLATLLDSAAAVIDEIGYERLTTAMVADRAGASIGTVYRYFPDRIAVLQSLAARNTERLTERLSTELVAGRHASAEDAVIAVLTTTTNLFRTEAGYRSVRVGDVIDLRPPLTDSTANAMLADAVADALVAHCGATDSGDFRTTVASAIFTIDAMLCQAFARSPKGDDALLDEAKRVVGAVIAGRL